MSAIDDLVGRNKNLAERVSRLETLEYTSGGVISPIAEGPGIDIVTDIVGLGGDSILLYDSGGAPVAEYPATDTGLDLALAAATSGDTVFLPSVNITGGPWTIPDGVLLVGIGWMNSKLTATGSSGDVIVINGPASGLADVEGISLIATATGTGHALCAYAGADNTLTLHFCKLTATEDGVNVAPLGASGGSSSNLLETFNVAHDAAYSTGAVNTAIGKLYLVEVSGQIQYAPSANALVDPAYYTTNNWSTYTRQNGAQFSDGTTPAPNDATYNVDHKFEYTRTGNGLPVSLRLLDSNYADNSGNWTAKVYELTDPPNFAVNVHGCEMDIVAGNPLLGDRAAYDTDTAPDKHAKDIEDETYLYHKDPENPSEGGIIWYNVKDYGAVGDGVADDTAAINASIAAISATGGVLYFPEGIYKTSGGHLISNPILILGNGGAGFDGSTGAISLINCTSATADLFTVTAYKARFSNIALANTAVSTPSAGSGIKVAGSTLVQRVDYEGVSIKGFYIDIDVQVGCSWSMRDCYLTAPVLYALKVQNTENGDAGDWSISDTNFFSALYDSNAAIRIESSGGGKITNVKINMALDNKKFNHGIDLAPAAITSVFLVSNTSIENVRANGINIANSAGKTYKFITLSNLEIQIMNTTGKAVNIAANAAGDLAYISMIGGTYAANAGNAQYAIALTNVQHAFIGGIVTNNFGGGFVSQTTCTDITVDTGPSSITVADTSTVNLTLTGSELSADVLPGGINAADLVSGAATDGQVLTADGAGGAAWEAPAGGAGAFIDLTDVPADYTGDGGKLVKVKATEDGLEFAAAGAGDGDVIGPAGATDGHIAVFDGATGKVIKDGGAAGSGDVTYAIIQAAQLVNEIKGWPPVVNTGDLDALNLWFDKVGTPSTAPSVVAVSGEGGVTENYELALKVVADGANEGLSQRWTYADEPRIKSGRKLSALLAIWSVSSVSVTAKLVNSDASETAASAVTAAAWTIVAIENHTLAGTYCDLTVTAGAAGTFYVVPLGANIGGRAFPLQPRPLRYVEAYTASVVNDVDPGTNWTDCDLTANSSPLAAKAFLHCFYASNTVDDDLRLRRNGDTTAKAGVVRNQIINKYVFVAVPVWLDDGQIFEFNGSTNAAHTEHVLIDLAGWWEWG